PEGGYAPRWPRSSRPDGGDGQGSAYRHHPWSDRKRVPRGSRCHNGERGCSWPAAGQGSRSACRRCADSGGQRPRANNGKPGRIPPQSRQLLARRPGPNGYPRLALCASTWVGAPLTSKSPVKWVDVWRFQDSTTILENKDGTCARDESSIQRLTAAELAGSLAFASARRRFEAVSIDSMSRDRNSLLVSPGGIGSRESPPIVPGLL